MRAVGRGAAALALTLLLLLAPARAQDTAASIAKARELEAAVEAVVDRAEPAYLVIGGGSGVLISDDGWAVTNHHVVATNKIGDRLWVRRASGERLRARLIGWDPRGDIALLKCDAKRPLPFLPLGDSDALRIGDLSIALGNPYGFASPPSTRDAEPTVTLGIVSAIHANRQNYSDAIQTDAAINPGNSGASATRSRRTRSRCSCRA
jgi:S1-C subfamily serine protease